MKKITIFWLLLFLSVTTFSQQTDPPPSLTKQDYLAKSKKQKTAAWTMVGGGATLMIVGSAFVSVNTSDYLFNGAPSRSKGVKTGEVLFYTGVLATVGSIPFFIASARNKRKAMSLSFKNEISTQIQKSGFVYRRIPSLNIKINL